MTRDGTDQGPSFGEEIAQHAWRLSGRVVAGLGQLLLWVITGIGRALRPVALRLGAKVYGPPRPHPGAGHDGRTRVAPVGAQTTPMPGWSAAWREFAASWYFAPLTGVALVIAALAELAPQGTPPISVAGGFAVASTLPLVWRREFLRPVAAVALSAFAAGLLSGQELRFTTVFAALYTLYALGRHLPRQSAGALAVGTLATIGVIYLAAGSLDEVPWPATMVAALAAIGLGDARRVKESAERTEAEAEERNNETLTRLTAVQREQAVMRERARIARELHDVVAHSVSMIAVQAETAPYTLQDLSPQAREGYVEIARTAREALVEMRRLLGVLRADAGTGPESAPQPRLDRLPDLIDQHRGAGGGDARLEVRGDPRDLSATVELSAYRIVQEALTNARRHAPGADVRVELAFLNDRLAVRVRDTGASAPTMVLDPSQAAGGSGGPGGHGLVGMQERATMLGGRFSAGPATEGGFMVEAELPFVREETSRSDAHPVPPPGHDR
ncbi:sensor histidine kinase [Thermomonospora umbrina]|uniref:histidine kinase n=1 Tax=Thermomonospora umbrina TaxID=111806 RepID=A0A3D9SZM5_9ACTN|nr:histidine kinase [Thermomonospora umbrina]REE98445.1 signal transduction histidine kinase [Thermomonospora umbrina]